MIAALLLAAAQEKSAPSQARFHPREAIFFVEVPDVAALLAAYEQAPLVRLVGDEEVRDTVEGLLEPAGVDLGALLGQAARDLGLPPEVALDPLAAALGQARSVSALSMSVSIAEAGGDWIECLKSLSDCRGELASIQTFLEEHARAHEGARPETLADLDGGLPEPLRTDPWGRAYAYERTPDGFSLRSLGADGEPGGEGLAADIDAQALVSLVPAMLAERLSAEVRIELVSPQSCRALADRIDGLLRRELGDSEKGALGPLGARVYRISAVEGMRATLVQGERFLHLAVGTAPIEEAQAESFSAGRATSVQERPEYAALAPRLEPAQGAVVLQGWADLSDAVELGKLAARRVGMDVGGVERLPPTLWRMQLAGGRFVTEAVFPRDPDPEGVSRWLAQAPVPAALFEALPADAVALGLVSFDPPGMYRRLMAEIHAGGGEEVTVHLSEVGERYAFDLEKDIVGSLGGSAALFLLPIKGPVRIPALMLVLEVRDPAALQRGLGGLLRLLEEEAGEQFRIKYRPYKVRDQGEVPMWIFSFGAEEGAWMTMQPQPALALVGKQLIVALNSADAKKQVRRVLGEEGEAHPLAASERPADATAIAYVDWGALFDSVYGTARALVGLVGSNGPLPVDPAQLPADLSTFTRFFEPTVAWMQNDERGIYVRWESSFGPETWLAIGGLGALGFAQARSGGPDAGEHPSPEDEARRAEAEAVAAKAQAQAAETKARLAHVATRLTVFRLDQKRYPASLAALLRPTPSFPKGYLDGGALPADAWGRALSYAAPADGSSYRLWSSGANGIDEEGQGDDVVQAP